MSEPKGNLTAGQTLTGELASVPYIPERMAHKLTFTGAVEGEYDGSSALNIEIPEKMDESDPTVPAWAKEESKPAYTAREVGAMPADAVVVKSINGKAPDADGNVEVQTVGEVDPEEVAAAVEDYMAAHPVVETDPTVPAWAKAPEKPSYTAEEVGALPVGTEIPTVPTTLPNPNKLTFSGAVSAEYDGSEAVEVVIPQGGGGGSVSSVNGQTGAVVLDADDVSALPLSGGTMTGELRVNGGDAAGGSKIVLEDNGMITDSGTSTLLGLWQGKTYYVGHSKYATVMRGSAARPTYNGNDLALYSDITVNSGGDSSNGAGVWEHICDITTTEQVDAGIVVTENSEGIPLSELKYNEIWVMAKMVGVDTNTNNWWSCRCTAHQTEVGGQTYNGTFNGAVSGGTTGTKYVSYYFFIRGGKAYWTDCAKIDPYAVGGGDQAWNNNYLDKYAFDYFTSVTMWADSARIIGADTEVRILGRRA